MRTATPAAQESMPARLAHHRLFALDGKIAIVTGAARGIGFGIAAALAAAGARLVLVDRSEEVEQRAADLRAGGCDTRAIIADLADEESPQRVVAQSADDMGGLDILVNNAAVLVRKDMHTIARPDWQRVIDVNLSACFFLAQAATRIMAQAGGGRVINLGSIVGQLARPQLAPYIAAKAGIAGLTRALAADLAGSGVNVNAIAPGFIVSDMSTAREGHNEFHRHVIETVPARRWGQPEDIAGVAVFLASDAARYVNGQVIYVDGGFTAAVK